MAVVFGGDGFADRIEKSRLRGAGLPEFTNGEPAVKAPADRKG
jgi:hypothetical protein